MNINLFEDHLFLQIKSICLKTELHLWDTPSTTLLGCSGWEPLSRLPRPSAGCRAFPLWAALPAGMGIDDSAVGMKPHCQVT